MTRPAFHSSAWLLACLIGGTNVPLLSQTHKVAAPEHVTRAIAVYEWTGSLDKPKASRLVPVSLFISGHMEDADIYLARPVPFALQYGNVYEVDEAGLKKGLFDVDHARNTQSFTKEIADTGASGWVGFGTFKPPVAPKIHTLQSSKQLATISSTGDSAKPRFATKDDKASSANSNKPDTSDDSDRPKLNRSTDQSSSPSSASSKDDDYDRPTLRKRDPAEDAQRRKAASGSSVRGPDVSLNDDPDRPTMRHGKPANAEGADDLTGIPADMHQVAAVSDAADRPEHVFAREWESPAERTETMAKLQALAQPLVARYVAANKLTPGTPVVVPVTPTAPPLPAAVSEPPSSTDDENAPKLQRGVPKAYQHPTPPAKAAPAASKSSATTHHTQAGSKTVAPKAKAAGVALALSNEQLTPYTLSYGGQPTFVYTAQASVTMGGPVYLTLVAQRMVSGEYQLSFSSVTDASHLDRTPWFRLVDAVDPDASHRASLLFELRGQSSRQFALYRLTSAQAEQIFITNAM